MEERKCAGFENVPGVRELFTAEALTQLRRDPALSERIAVLRDREAKLVFQMEKTGPLEVNRLCQEHIIQLLDEEDAAKIAVTPEDSGAFLQAVCLLSRNPFTAQLRRRVREIARVYRLQAKNAMSLPQDVNGFRQLWELAMEGEPRWSEDFPNSAFRDVRAVIMDAPLLKGNVLRVCSAPKNIHAELAHLLDLLSDNTLMPEIRAACSFALFEWIHPFMDGNGHTGRMLMIAALGRLYQLPTVVCFSSEIVMGKSRAGKLLDLLRTGEGNLNDFCSGVLARLEGAQTEAAKILRKPAGSRFDIERETGGR